MIKILANKSLKVHLLHPTYGNYLEESLFFGRKGKRLQIDTGFTYLEANDDVGSAFGVYILGFGISFYWNFSEEMW